MSTSIFPQVPGDAYSWAPSDPRSGRSTLKHIPCTPASKPAAPGTSVQAPSVRGRAYGGAPVFLDFLLMLYLVRSTSRSSSLIWFPLNP